MTSGDLCREDGRGDLFRVSLDTAPVFLEEQLCRAVAGLMIIEIFVKTAVAVGDADGKGLRGKHIFRVLRRDADPLPHGHQKQRRGQILHLDNGYLTPGGFFRQHPVLRVRAHQLPGMGHDDTMLYVKRTGP